jgi:hypothetical protein
MDVNGVSTITLRERLRDPARTLRDADRWSPGV